MNREQTWIRLGTLGLFASNSATVCVEKDVNHRSKAFLVVLILGAAVPLAAKQESRTFDKPPAVVFKAALQVAGEDGVVTHSDKDDLTLTFKSGGYWNKGFDVQVQVEKVGADKSRVILKPQKEYFGVGWGAAKRINEKFFHDLESKLSGERAKDTQQEQ